jgi:hypothetical protein
MLHIFPQPVCCCLGIRELFCERLSTIGDLEFECLCAGLRATDSVCGKALCLANRFDCGQGSYRSSPFSSQGDLLPASGGRRPTTLLRMEVVTTPGGNESLSRSGAEAMKASQPRINGGLTSEWW